MNKNYIMSLGILLLSMPMLAQTTLKTDKRTPTETSKISEEIVYCIDGFIAKSPIEFFRLTSEQILSINFVTDPKEIAKRFPRRGEPFKSVIVVETVNNPRPSASVVSEHDSKIKSKKN
jgi:Mlc titration factor MtfA (ptsG expression regulator)